MKYYKGDRSKYAEYLLEPMRMKTNIIILALFLCISMGEAQGNQSAIVWDEPIRISYDSTTSAIPQVISTGDTIHIMWFGTIGNSFSDSGYGINYSRSIDGGKTFSIQKRLVPFTEVNKSPRLAVSNSHVYIIYLATVPPPVYLAASILRSTDAGETWEPSRVIKDYDAWCVAARDSHIYIHGGAVYDNKYYNTMMTSSDYGLTWDTAYISLFRGPNVARFAFTKNAMHLIRSIGVHANLEIYYNRSIDQGKSWSSEVFISSNDSIESQNPRIAASDSTVYVTWNDGKYGGFFSGTVMVRRSTDEGLTWQDEQIISQKTTAVFCDISASGNKCAVVWDSDENNVGSYRIRTSIDRGVTFAPTTDLAPDDQRPGDPAVFLENNTVHTAWWDQYNTDVYYRKGVWAPLSVPKEKNIPTAMTLHQNYPNPFNPNTTIQYDIPISGLVVMNVVDMLGRHIQTLINEIQEPGSHSVNFDGSRLSSGMYIYKLTSGSFTQTKRMMLVK